VSDFCAINKPVVARKKHKCTYCAEPINAGDEYIYQRGNYDGNWYENKLHEECYIDLQESGDDSFLPYSNERPLPAALSQEGGR